MPRLQHAVSGVVVSCDEETAARLGTEWTQTGDAPSDSADYAALKVADLRAEIERRNEGRDEADQLSVEGKKADLVAALEADDASADDSAE